MKQLFSLGIVFCFSTSLLYATDQNQELYQFDGHSRTSKDLSPALQQAVYDIQYQAYSNMQTLADVQALDDYASIEAKKEGLTLEKYEEQNFKGKKVSEQEAKTWFEANKSHLGGHHFDSLKVDIIQVLQSEVDQKVRWELLKKLKADGRFHFTLNAPQAPVLDIHYRGFPTKGSSTPKVTIVEFADYACPNCRIASKLLKSLTDKYKDQVQFVYLDFPIERTGVSKKVAEGAVCADHQKKFWEYHDMAFEDHALTAKSPVDFAKKLGLDMESFKTCMNSDDTHKKVNSAKMEGDRIGVTGTPVVFFNGRKIYGHTEAMLEDALKKLL